MLTSELARGALVALIAANIAVFFLGAAAQLPAGIAIGIWLSAFWCWARGA